jgi:hypothetical protein
MRNRAVNKQSKKLSIAAGIFLVFLIIIGDFAAGFVGIGSRAPGIASSCPSSPASPCLTKVQTGTGSVVLSSASVGSTTITFSPAYSATPNFKILQMNVATPPTNLYQTSSLAFISLISVGQTWTSMPAGVTEIFGDQKHELWMDLTQSTSVLLETNCPTGSVSAGAYLTVQYSTDGTTWNAIEIGTALRTLIDGGNLLGNCQIGPFPAVSNNGVPVALVAGAKAKVFLRVVGANGGGLGDNPVFTEIHLLVFTNIGVSCNYGTSPLGLTAAAATVRVTCSALVTFTYSFQWIAGVPR